MEMTQIQEFYKGQSVLITGATGFCGKMLLETLLRSCPNIGKIYLLMRPKKGQDVNERLANLLRERVSSISSLPHEVYSNTLTQPWSVAVSQTSHCYYENFGTEISFLTSKKISQ
jgi:hypothetical protein